MQRAKEGASWASIYDAPSCHWSMFQSMAFWMVMCSWCKLCCPAISPFDAALVMEEMVAGELILSG